MLTILAHLAIQVALILRALLRPHREPAARIAWIVVILALPFVGIIAYVLLGETNLGRTRVARLNRVMQDMPPSADIPGMALAAAAGADLHERHEPLFRVGQSISGFAAVGGNQADLMADSDAAISAMIADIDAARDHVHLMFYIWLPDGNGTRMAEALIRAAGRARAGEIRPLGADGRGRGSAGAGPVGGQPAVAGADGPDRPAQPPQDPGDRQCHHLLRQPELRRPSLPAKGEICALGRCGDALHRPGGAAEPGPFCQRLAGRDRG
jgi:hypothetical protein